MPPRRPDIVHSGQDVDPPPRGPGGGLWREDGGDVCGTLCQRKANAYELTSVQNLKTHTRADRQTDKRTEAEPTGACQRRRMRGADERGLDVRI